MDSYSQIIFPTLRITDLTLKPINGRCSYISFSAYPIVHSTVQLKKNYISKQKQFLFITMYQKLPLWFNIPTNS